MTAAVQPPGAASTTALLHPARVGPLRRTLRAALASVPAYRALWGNAGIDPRRLALPEEFTRLPIVGKAELAAFAVAERCRADLPGALTIERTSGSSGEPFDVALSAGEQRRRRLRFLKALLECGYRPGMRLLLFGRGGDTAATRALRWRYLAITASEEELAQAYRRFLPHVVYGPLNTLLALAEGLGGALDGRSRPRAVISTAEQLRPAARRRLHAVFGVEPGDFFGLTETGLLAWRPGGADAYRTIAGGWLLELLPAAEDPALERLVVTSLEPVAMPLIRYDTGDLVRRSPGAPPRAIVGFCGRRVDCLVLPDGRRLSPYRVTLALEEIAGLRRYRVRQLPDASLTVDAWIGPEAVAQSIRASIIETLERLTAGRLAVSVQAHWAEREGAGGRAAKFHPVRSALGANR